MRICSTCKQAKEDSEFHRDRTQPGGVKCYCKACAKQRDQARYNNQTDMHLARIKDYQQTIPGKLAYGKAQAKRRGNLITSGEITTLAWQTTLGYFGYACAYCRKVTKLEQEHVRPLSKGGQHNVKNLVPACRSCNASKHDSEAESWFRQQSFFTEEQWQKLLNFIS